MARPTTFNRKTFDLICERMAAGQTLREVCRADDMPPESTVRCWAVMDQPPGIAAQYRRAREALAECWADESIEIADDGTNDWMTRKLRNGATEVVLDREHVERSKLRVSQRNWMLGRLLRGVYGESKPKEDAPSDSGGAIVVTGGLPPGSAKDDPPLPLPPD